MDDGHFLALLNKHSSSPRGLPAGRPQPDVYIAAASLQVGPPGIKATASSVPVRARVRAAAVIPR